MKLKLGPLPDTGVAKTTISLSIPLRAQLEEYTQLHAQTFGGTAADVPTIIPHILQAFLNRDREFQRLRRQRKPKSTGTASA